MIITYFYSEPKLSKLVFWEIDLICLYSCSRPPEDENMGHAILQCYYDCIISFMEFKSPHSKFMYARNDRAADSEASLTST